MDTKRLRQETRAVILDLKNYPAQKGANQLSAEKNRGTANRQCVQEILSWPNVSYSSSKFLKVFPLNNQGSMLLVMEYTLRKKRKKSVKNMFGKVAKHIVMFSRSQRILKDSGRC